MAVIRRHYGNDVDPIFPLCFAFDQLVPRWIVAFVGNPDGAAVPPRSLRVRGKSGSHNVVITIKTRTGTMNLPNYGSGTAADDCQSKPAANSFNDHIWVFLGFAPPWEDADLAKRRSKWIQIIVLFGRKTFRLGLQITRYLALNLSSFLSCKMRRRSR